MLNVNSERLISIESLQGRVLLNTAVLAMLLAATQIRIPVIGSPVPVTLQTLILLYAALVYKMRSLPAVIFWVSGAAFGLPFMAGTFGGPTTGYQLSFIPAYLFVSALTGVSIRNYLLLFLTILSGMLLILTGGTLHLLTFFSFEKAFTAGFLPFIPGAVLKTIAIITIYAKTGQPHE